MTCRGCGGEVPERDLPAKADRPFGVWCDACARAEQTRPDAISGQLAADLAAHYPATIEEAREKIVGALPVSADFD